MRSHVFSGRPDPTRPSRSRTHLWSSLLALLLCSLLALSMAPQAQAASLSKKPPHKLTTAQIQAIQQQLKKQIHVKHTGHALKPAGATQGAAPMQPIRPLASNLPAYNNIGITDPATRSSGNFSGTRSLSAQALQDVGLVPGITITSQNVTFIWPSVPTAQPDNYAVNGQTFTIPVSATSGAATVGLLGASTGNASGSSGTATLTYTDSTTSTFTLDFTDWWNGALQPGNAVAVSMDTIDTRHGTKSGTFDLYSFVTSLNTSKTLQSVTLPTSTTGGQLHVFAVGVGGPAFNNTGISDNSALGSADFDDGSANYSYSAQSLASADLVPGHQFDSDGIAYPWPTAASGTADNYQAAGQILPVIPVPNATTFGFLGAATNGPSGGTATITYTDGSTQTFTLGFNDWWGGTAQYSNQTVATFSVINGTSGQRSGTYYLYTDEVTLQTGKTVLSVTLPSSVTQGHLHVFAVGTRSLMNNLGTSNNMQPGEGNYGTSYGGGGSYSIQDLEDAGIRQGQSFSFNGINFTWPASYGFFADNYQAAGQTIPVTPVPNATTIGFIGSAGYGPSTGTATLTYTDGTTTTFSLGFTDWWSPSCALSYGNLIVAKFSSVNVPAGQQNGTYCIYYAETSLAAGKTLQSVTLPSSVNQGQLHVFAVGTRSQYNNTGISDDSNPAGANFDGYNDSYSEEDFQNPNVAGWNPGDTLTYEGINYIWPGVPAAQADNYEAQGQVLPISAPSGATTLGFVGAATGAGSSGASGTVTLTYTDNSTSTFTLTLSDWMLGGNNSTFGPVSGNRLFALLPHRNTLQGQQAVNTYLFEVETPLNASKQLQSVTLPASVTGGQIHVFMMATRTGENYPNNVGTSDDSDTVFASLDGNGASYSIEALETAGVYEGQPFTFNGVTFNWPASYSVIPDNYQAAGQTIPATQIAGSLTSAGTLAFLGASTNAGPSKYDTGTATIHYTDGTSTTFTLAMTDWWSPTAQSGDQIAARCPYINNAMGQQTQAVNLYYTSVSVTAGKTIQSVTLPSTVSSGQMHIFAVGTKVGTDAPGLVGFWKFDEGNGTTTADASGSGYTGTLTGGPTWTTGITGDALSFAGNGSTVDINQSVLNTSNSYSVAAWVQLSSLNNYHTAVSQDGTNVSGFYLQYTGSVFAFSTVSTDSTSGTTTRATASTTPTLNTWYYLVGVYDASSNQIKLYVNGALVSTKSVPAAWNATGEAVIGRSKWNGTTADSWTGLIDNVQMYDRALSDQEVTTLYNAG